MANPWEVEFIDESAPCVTLPRYTHMANEKQAMQQFEELVRHANSVEEIDPEFVLCNGETIEHLAIYHLLRYKTKRLRNQKSNSATGAGAGAAGSSNDVNRPYRRVVNILETYHHHVSSVSASSEPSLSSLPHPTEQASDP